MKKDGARYEGLVRPRRRTWWARIAWVLDSIALAGAVSYLIHYWIRVFTR